MQSTAARAEALFNRGDIEESRALFERLVADEPGAPTGHYGLGMVALVEERFEEAEQAFDRALERDPDHSNAHYQRGVLAEVRGDFDAAIDAYERTLELYPSHIAANERLRVLEQSFEADEVERPGLRRRLWGAIPVRTIAVLWGLELLLELSEGATMSGPIRLGMLVIVVIAYLGNLVRGKVGDA